MKDIKTGPAAPLNSGEHFAEINGITIHYYVRGNGPVLLFPSPGWGPSVNYVIPLTSIEKHCTVVYFDTRHSGKSTGPEGAGHYKLENFVADIEALRIYLNQPKIFIAGHSGGGHQILAYGIEHNEHLLGIISIDAIAAADGARAEELMRRIERKKNEPFYLSNPGYHDKATALMMNTDKASTPLKDVISTMGAFYFYRPEMAAAAFANMDYNDDVFRYTQLSGFQGKNLLPDLHRITVPTLIIVGEDDFICDPITQGKRMHEQISLSHLEIIKESGHMPWIEQPDLFNSVIQNWFKENTFNI
jgi:proline iminopeptidase